MGLSDDFSVGALKYRCDDKHHKTSCDSENCDSILQYFASVRLVSWLPTFANVLAIASTNVSASKLSSASSCLLGAFSASVSARALTSASAFTSAIMSFYVSTDFSFSLSARASTSA